MLALSALNSEAKARRAMCGLNRMSSLAASLRIAFPAPHVVCQRNTRPSCAGPGRFQESAVDEHDPLPLAIFAPGCVYRAAALEALDDAGRAWRHDYNSPSRDGLDVAVSAGLAVTIVAASALRRELRVLGPAQGFPDLPMIEIFLFRPPGEASAPIAMLAEVIADTLEIKATQAA